MAPMKKSYDLALLIDPRNQIEKDVRVSLTQDVMKVMDFLGDSAFTKTLRPKS